MINLPGSVKVWDPRQKDKPVANMAPAEGDAYSTEERSVVAGYDNGDIKMFDLKKMAVRWETNVKNGVCGLEFDRKDIMMNKLVATTLESKFHVFDVRTQHPEKGFASLSEKEGLCVCTSLDQSLRVIIVTKLKSV
ncbi:Dynein axonemal assembly factor 10 [Acropora cervicornis]|uniref:Dynein axonemal assembly factor 10 n=1 Tax=Acropora cervicornis TaxID=6130 RepID=A0AAD9QWH3_ACRCE|nr:Dynein axonemal assembly factor 10 [Acropora cervicornis]